MREPPSYAMCLLDADLHISWERPISPAFISLGIADKSKLNATPLSATFHVQTAFHLVLQEVMHSIFYSIPKRGARHTSKLRHSSFRLKL